MSAADRLRSQGQRVAQKASNRSEQGQAERAAARPDTRTTPVGKTVKLAPSLNEAVSDWQGKAATELGLGRVTFQQFIEAACYEILNDAELGARIMRRIDSSRA